MPCGLTRPELEPIDERDPSRNHPSRIESPTVEALSEDEVDRMRARLDKALGNGGAAAPAEGTAAAPVEPVEG